MSVNLEFNYAGTTSKIENFNQDAVVNILEWTKTAEPSKYVPKDLTEKQIVLFFNACELDVGKTKLCIEKYYSCRKNAPELFNNRLVLSKELKPSVDALEFSFLPEKSVEGYDIIFHRLHDTEPSKYHLEAGCKLLFMTVDACLNARGPQPGFIFLFDMRGVRLGHLTRVSLSTLRKFFQYIQEGMPVRMRAIHVMNSEPVLDKLLLLIRPFMDKKFFDMMKFHNKNEDLTEFYEKVISKSALPSDFGGSLPDTQILHHQCMEELSRLDSYWSAEEEQRKRAISKDKLNKSFKKLDID